MIEAQNKVQSCGAKRASPENLSEGVRQMKYLQQRIAEVREETLVAAGHQFEDMVDICTFAGVSCKTYNWTQFWHYLYGNCYVFNTAMKAKNASGYVNRVYKSTVPGPAEGLFLRMSLEGDEYVGNFSRSAGVRVHIGGRHEMPFPDAKGFSVPPGQETYVGMRKVHIERADPFENNSCVANLSLEIIKPDLYRNVYGVQYSATACRFSCVANLQRTNCGCVEAAFAVNNDLKDSVCDLLNLTTVNCLERKASETIKINGTSCLDICTMPCQDDLYTLTLSSSLFPSPSYESTLQDENPSIKDSISKNILVLRVFFEEHNYQIIQEQLSYDILSVLSDMGGQMGMWIGISVLTCAEVVELLGIIVLHMCHKFQKNSKVDDEEATDEKKGHELKAKEALS